MLLKNPAWNELSPPLPQFTIAQNKIAGQLQKTLNLKGQVYVTYCDNLDEGHYLIRQMNGEAFYIKTASISAYAHLSRAEQVATWLVEQGHNVNAVLRTTITHINNMERILLIYPYILGRRIESNHVELTLLAKSLARLHSSLKQHPDSNHWKIQTKKRYVILEAIRKEIVAKKYNLGKKTDVLSELAVQFDFHLLSEYEGGQPLHGDLNPGNLLIDQKNIIHYFDFEDVLHSHQAVISELAYVIERFILAKIDNEQEAIKLGRAFIETYCLSGGKYEFQPDFSKILELLALKAFCILVLSKKKGIRINSSEWKKFFYLLTLVQKKQTVFKKIIM